MPGIISNKKYIYLLSYVLLVISIFLLNTFFEGGLALSVSATLMLLIPFFFKADYDYFNFKLDGFIRGLIILLLILVAYIAVLKGYTLYSNKEFGLRDFTISFILVQFLLIAIPEEVFFRGFLQKSFGNTIKAVFFVSFLFAIAHLITVCGTGRVSSLGCGQNALTFFPSIVMGYLYVKTETLWSSIIFHFLANLTHILIKIG